MGEPNDSGEWLGARPNMYLLASSNKYVLQQVFLYLTALFKKHSQFNQTIEQIGLIHGLKNNPTLMLAYVNGMFAAVTEVDLNRFFVAHQLNAKDFIQTVLEDKNISPSETF